MAYSAGAQKRYNEKNFTFVTLKIHNEKEADILETLAKLTATGESRQSVIKRLIRKEAEK